jgi:hypothetical protein
LTFPPDPAEMRAPDEDLAGAAPWTLPVGRGDETVGRGVAFDGDERMTCGVDRVAARGGADFDGSDRMTCGVDREAARGGTDFDGSDRMTGGVDRVAARGCADFDGSERMTGGFARVDGPCSAERSRGVTTWPPRVTGCRGCGCVRGLTTAPGAPLLAVLSTLRPVSRGLARSGFSVPKVGVRSLPRWFSNPRRPSSRRPSRSRKSSPRGPLSLAFHRPGPRSFGRQSRPRRSQVTRSWTRRCLRSRLK